VIGRLFVCMGLCLLVYSSTSTAWLNAKVLIGTTTDDSEKLVVTGNKNEIAIKKKATRTPDGKDDSEKLVVTDNKKEITIKKKATRTPDGKDDSEKLIVTDNKKEITIKKKATRTPDGKVFSHFLSHNPKSGTSYAFEAIHKLLWPSPEWLALPKDKHFRGCNEASNPTANFRTEYRVDYKGNLCTMWMSEMGYTSSPEHIYAIVREPKEHILSMYFHCKESVDHKRFTFGKQKMPSLDDWLDAWVDAIGNKTKERQNSRFHCDNLKPINLQSKFVRFDPDKGKEGLKSRYDVIGDNAQMAKTVCVIFIRYTGWVPKECDCSIASNTSLSIESNWTAVNISSSSGRRQLRESTSRRRRLSLEYDIEKHSHGVTNHGATFNTTRRQDEAIAKLRVVDSLLYNVAREVFKEQVHEVEEEYQIKVCDHFREQGGDSRRR
jgi:hypothetical protein